MINWEKEFAYEHLVPQLHETGAAFLALAKLILRRPWTQQQTEALQRLLEARSQALQSEARTLHGLTTAERFKVAEHVRRGLTGLPQ